MKAEERKLLLVGAALLLGTLLFGARRKTVSENKSENTGNEKSREAKPGACADDLGAIGSVSVGGLTFDTAKRTAFIILRSNRLHGITLMSNFRFTQNSKIHWSDESSYGTCTHPCTREEVAGLYEEIKAAGIERWETGTSERESFSKSTRRDT